MKIINSLFLGASRNDDFKRNRALQCQNNVATLCCAKNVANNLL